MLRQALISLKLAAATLTAFAALTASTANAQDVDLSSIANDDVKKEASSGSWLPSWGSPSKKAPAVASGSSSSSAWYDPMGLFTGSSEPEQPKQAPRRSGLGVTSSYNGSTLENAKYVKSSGGAWWDPLGLIYPAEETVVYEDVNSFLSQPRMND